MSDHTLQRFPSFAYIAYVHSEAGSVLDEQFWHERFPDGMCLEEERMKSKKNAQG